MLFLSLFLSSGYYALIPLTSATLHEAGHIAAAKFRGVSFCRLNVGILGARLSASTGVCSYKDEIVICAAGPAVNFICAAVGEALRGLYNFESEAYSLFFLSSLCLGILNLLPIKSFDGGRILSSLLSHIFGISAAEKALGVLSFLSLFALWSISLYLLLKTAASLSLFVFSLSLFASLFSDTFENESQDETKAFGRIKKQK